MLSAEWSDEGGVSHPRGLHNGTACPGHHKCLRARVTQVGDTFSEEADVT